MKPLTPLIPLPQTVRLGGRDFPVWEARLRDLAQLQGWLDAQAGDPAGDAFAAFTDPTLTPEERRAALVAAHARAEAGPPIDGSPEAAALFRTAEGVGVFLAVALARGTPGLGAGELAAVLADMTREEYDRLRRVFFGVPPLRACEQLLHEPPPPSGGTVTWGEAVDQVAREYGWTYSQVYDMTPTEFANARRGGKPAGPAEIAIPEGMSLEAAVREQCLRYYGKPPEEVWPDPPATTPTRLDGFGPAL